MSIHPTAIIDRNAEIHPSVSVGANCVIEGPVHIDAGVRLFHNVYLTGRTHIAENCVLHPGVIVGHEPQDVKYDDAPTFCRIGRGTVIREYATIHRGTDPESGTIVGEDCFLLGGSHVAHNCVVGDRVTLVNNVLLGGHVQIGDGAMLGGAAVVHQFVRIGELVMVAGNTRVTMDVPPFAMTDAEGRVAGLNRIGTRRAGLSTEEFDEIRQAYRILYTRGLSVTEAARVCRDRFRTDPVARLSAFLEGPGKRGLAGRARRSR